MALWCLRLLVYTECIMLSERFLWPIDACNNTLLDGSLCTMYMRQSSNPCNNTLLDVRI
jgi:hypothetical protein